MKRRMVSVSVVTASLLAAGGCGVVPDVVVNSARSAAKDALDEAVEGVVDEAVDQLFDAGSALLPDPFAAED